MVQIKFRTIKYSHFMNITIMVTEMLTSALALQFLLIIIFMVEHYYITNTAVIVIQAV